MNARLDRTNRKPQQFEKVQLLFGLPSIFGKFPFAKFDGINAQPLVQHNILLEGLKPVSKLADTKGGFFSCQRSRSVKAFGIVVALDHSTSSVFLRFARARASYADCPFQKQVTPGRYNIAISHCGLFEGWQGKSMHSSSSAADSRINK